MTERDPESRAFLEEYKREYKHHGPASFPRSPQRIVFTPVTAKPPQKPRGDQRSFHHQRSFNRAGIVLKGREEAEEERRSFIQTPFVEEDPGLDEHQLYSPPPWKFEFKKLFEYATIIVESFPEDAKVRVDRRLKTYPNEPEVQIGIRRMNGVKFDARVYLWPVSILFDREGMALMDYPSDIGYGGYISNAYDLNTPENVEEIREAIARVFQASGSTFELVS